MIVNFEEVDKRIEKILDVLVQLGYSYEIFSPKRFNIIDNNVSFAEKRNIGVITQYNDGKIGVKIYGYKNRQKLKTLMRSNEVVFKASTTLTEIGSSVRKLFRKYIESNKLL